MEILRIRSQEEKQAHADILQQMFRLRARQFAGRRQWNVNVVNAQESDQFDQLDPLYVTVVSRGRLLASLRLLPTTGPHMLADVFPETMGNAPVIRHQLIWESSRFCVDTDAARTFSPDGINLVTRRVLFGLFQTAMHMGHSHVVSVFDVYVERILKRSGLQFALIGPIVKYDRDLRTRAAIFDVSDAVLAALTSPMPALQGAA